ncbi:FLCN family protein [Megaselia abdita]
MNGIIGLCNFCESHGPVHVFCTQTLRDTKIEDFNLSEQSQVNENCSACNSLVSNAIYSVDKESGATFLSTQNPTIPEIVSLVKQAAIRSLSSEVNVTKDGGFVFFGDSSRAHVLSHTFHISDSQARGFYQQFSIVFLMKDKYFLLNIKPFLSQNFQRISTELKAYAQKVYDAEVIQDSPRQRRCSVSHQQQASRSLIELTGEQHIYPILHSHFSWILLAGARVLTEHLTFGNLPWLPTNWNGMPRHFIGLPRKSLDDHCEEDHEDFYSLRTMKNLMGPDFVPIVFCALTGIKIVLRGAPSTTYDLMVCLRRLVPETMHNSVQHDSPQYLENSECRIVSVSPEIGVPIASHSLLRIDLIENEGENMSITVKWNSQVPSKWPELLSKIMKAVEEPLFNHLVLNKHTKVLIEEWKK